MTDRKIDLRPCEPGSSCVDCGQPADGVRPNMDAEPSCRQCEADRLALIEIILSGDDEPAQGSLFDG
jgi:hypothetical protein